MYLNRAFFSNVASPKQSGVVKALGPVSRRLGLLVAFALASTSLMAIGATPALAQPSPWWHLTTNLRPANLQPDSEGTIGVQATNLGDSATSGAVTVVDTLPAGVTAQNVHFTASPRFGKDINFAADCETLPGSVRCTYPEALPAINPYEVVEMQIGVQVAANAASGGENQVEVSGGGAPGASLSRPWTVQSGTTSFGVEDFELVPEEEGGTLDTRAGSHPFQLSSTIILNQTADLKKPPALVKDLQFKLPAGLVGNATVLPQCSEQDFGTIIGGAINLCPENTVAGAVVITVDEPAAVGLLTTAVPLFNLAPSHGEPARFGFDVVSAPVTLDTSVRSGPGEDYGITVTASNLTQLVNPVSTQVTFWGTPGDPRHDQSRGWGCIAGEYWIGAGSAPPCLLLDQGDPPPLLTLPTNCTSPFNPIVEGDSWPTKATPQGITFSAVPYALKDSSGNPLGGLTGCNQVPFTPTMSAEPTTESASSPSGLDFNLNFEEEGLAKNANGLAQSQLEDTSVTLPEGFTINPSAGVGLGGCTQADYANETIESASGAGCPNDSKLGTVEIETPLLTQKILGSIFVAQPYENPSGSLVALYIVAKSPETGVLIKLAGKVVPDPVTGRLVTTFENNPQLPFDHFNFHFREGQQAPLVSPPTCGTFAAQALLTPWSEPASALTDTSSFTITKGAEGGTCPAGGAPPFHPHIEAGTQNNNAGTFSPLYVHLTRTDAEQEISSFSTDLPSGLTGDLVGIPLCPEANIALAKTKTGGREETEPSCPGTSQIGHTLVGTGVGAVLAYVPGKLYLAGPYNGDPFSIVSVTSAVVGPFDLGTVVIRFGLRIDPITAQASVDPSASEPIPTIIKGIVTHVRDIRVYVDRANFTLNPTSCTPTSISSTLGSSLGQNITAVSPFQAASCANLKFAPKFAVSTNGRTSKANGASLSVKLTYPTGALGNYANLARVKVDLPKQLPSRLTTLQKACTAAQFNANPAGCPAASIIGHAKAITPLIPVPLEGPAYFVSHGGEAFPSLIMVLQGYGVTIDLVGTTFISKAGITSSTFKAVPDQPIGSFELTLPQGKFSALAANGNLCTSKLTMPTEFLGQNGAKINQSTKVSVTGCAKAKALTRPQKLAKALKACHKKAKAKRAGCEKQARNKYGPVKKTKKKK
jgi:hypothetical protein